MEDGLVSARVHFEDRPEAPADVPAVQRRAVEDAVEVNERSVGIRSVSRLDFEAVQQLDLPEQPDLENRRRLRRSRRPHP